MRGFHSDGFPIYQAATARAANTEYFKHLATTQPGNSKAILGNLCARPHAEESYMIVRISHREPRKALHLQTVSIGGIRDYKPSPRTVYNITHSTYVIVKQRWEDGEVQELSHHETPEQARAAFKLLTGGNPLRKTRNMYDSPETLKALLKE